MKKVITISSVLLGVVFLAGCGQQPVSQTQPTTPAPVAQTPTQPAPVISITKTYANAKYGFEFSYPNEFEVKEQSNSEEVGPGGAVFSLNIGDNISVVVAKIEKGLRNGTDPLAEPNGMDPVSKKDTMIAGLNGRIYNDGEVYVVAKNGYQYYLQIFDTKKPGKDTLTKIVATFKFTK